MLPYAKWYCTHSPYRSPPLDVELGDDDGVDVGDPEGVAVADGVAVGCARALLARLAWHKRLH